MVRNTVLTLLWLIGISAMLFILGFVGAAKEWFDLGISGGMVSGSLIALFVFCAALMAVLPYHRLR